VRCLSSDNNNRRKKRRQTFHQKTKERRQTQHKSGHASSNLTREIGNAEPKSTVAGREIYENRRSRLTVCISPKQNALLALMPMDAGRTPVRREQTRLGVYHDVLRRLRDAGAPEAAAPDFADKLWTHFHRFNYRCNRRQALLHASDSTTPVLLTVLTYSDWCRYAIDVNVERAEDVLTHMRLLDKATRPENQPAFSVRVVQVRCDSCTSLQFALCCTDKFHVFFFRVCRYLYPLRTMPVNPILLSPIQLNMTPLPLQQDSRMAY
jgi:hypothetical protein